MQEWPVRTPHRRGGSVRLVLDAYMAPSATPAWAATDVRAAMYAEKPPSVSHTMGSPFAASTAIGLSAVPRSATNRSARRRGLQAGRESGTLPRQVGGRNREPTNGDRPGRGRWHVGGGGLSSSSLDGACAPDHGNVKLPPAGPARTSPTGRPMADRTGFVVSHHGMSQKADRHRWPRSSLGIEPPLSGSTK